MSWYTQNAGDISFVALVAVAGLGMLVSFVHNLTRRFTEKVAFAVVFVALAAVAAHANRTDREGFEAKLTGGSNYCFFALRADGDKLQLQRRNSGVSQIPRMQFEMYRQNVSGTFDVIGGSGSEFTCVVETIDVSSGPFEFGRYKFHFRAANGLWDQLWTLTESNGYLVEEITILREGRDPLQMKPARFPLRAGSNIGRAGPAPKAP